MEFKNLDFNILYVLGEDCCRSGTTGPFEMNSIFTEFSDIPAEDLKAEFIALDKMVCSSYTMTAKIFHLPLKVKRK